MQSIIILVKTSSKPTTRIFPIEREANETLELEEISRLFGRAALWFWMTVPIYHVEKPTTSDIDSIVA
jgi:hypothetical protein